MRSMKANVSLENVNKPHDRRLFVSKRLDFILISTKYAELESNTIAITQLKQPSCFFGYIRRNNGNVKTISTMQCVHNALCFLISGNWPHDF